MRVLTDWLRDAGCFTANIRHLAAQRQERFFRGTGKTDWNFHYEGRPFDTDRSEDLKSHQPFYAQVNFPETHRGGAGDSAHEHIERRADPARVQLPPHYPDHPVARADGAQYLNTVMALDRKVDFVLEKLETEGLARNTVVVFMGDHGRAMVRGKQWCYDSGLRIPLITRWPEGIPAPDHFRPGTVDERLVAALDLTAPTLSLAGVEPPLSYASATPATDGPRVYVLFADGTLAALDLEGQVIWICREVRSSSRHGLGTSPAIHGDLLITAFDGSSAGEDEYLGWKKPWEGALRILSERDAEGFEPIFNGRDPEGWAGGRSASRGSRASDRVAELRGPARLGRGLAGSVMALGFSVLSPSPLITVEGAKRAARIGESEGSRDSRARRSKARGRNCTPAAGRRRRALRARARARDRPWD